MKKQVKVGFSGFWQGFNIESFISRHPYLTEKYQFVECNRPDFLFVSVFKFEDGKITVIRDSTTISIPPVDACKIFYTGENVTPDFSRFDYAIGFSLEQTSNNFYLPNWVPRLHATGLECDDLLLKNRTHLGGRDFEELGFCNFVYRNTGVEYREDLFNALNLRKFVSAPGLSCNNSRELKLISSKF